MVRESSPGIEAASERHAGEATTVRQHYDHLTLAEKQQIATFLALFNNAFGLVALRP